jgi:SAM dependent carboxyl methyltransferase
MLNTQQSAVMQHCEASTETTPSHGVMEGNGAYNKHAQPQAAGASLATPVLQKALEKIPLEPGEQPIIVADYGSSQGKNSLTAVGSAIRNLRIRLGAHRSICIFHIDQPSNDFNSLFGVLTSDPERYVLNQENVFPCAIGRSFYEQVLPSESVHLGWSSNAAMWLSRIPSLIPGHFWSVRSTGAARAAFERQSADDWEAFLSLRAREMRPGARLVVVLPGPPNDLSSGVAVLMDSANAVLQEMIEESAITADERGAMVLGAHPRRKDELLAPFAKEGHFQRLVVENYGESVPPDAAWSEFQASGDKETLAQKRALFFRSTFMPSLAFALTRVRDGDREAFRVFAERLESGLTRRLVSQPVPAGIAFQTITLAKSR